MRRSLVVGVVAGLGLLLAAALHGGGIYRIVAVPSQQRAAIVVRLNRWTGSMIACVQVRADQGMICEPIHP